MDSQLPKSFIIILAVVQAIALTLLYSSIENNVWPATSPTWLVSLITFSMSFPLLMLMTVNKNNIKSNKEVPKVASEPLKYHGYIELGMFNNQYDAKVSLGEIIIKHYVALSGLTPYIEEVIVDGIQMMYVIKLGPFNNRERVDFICDKLTKQLIRLAVDVSCNFGTLIVSV